MQMAPDRFLGWFSDEQNAASQHAALAKIFSVATLLPGRLVKVALTSSAVDGVEITVRLNICDQTGLRRLEAGLRSGRVKVRASVWIDAGRAVAGVSCAVSDRTVALITAHDVVRIEIINERFATIDARNDLL